MSSWAIVALPDEDDYVWKISSEKKPHITLLFLGDQTGNKHEVSMASFVQHVANTSLTRFGLTVDRRGLLGDKNADVLFFDQQSSKQLRTARLNLLKNDAIFAAYSSVEQYPEWTPHLTLGYPGAPAKEDDRDYPGTHWVNFNKLALWNSDFDGYEFLLKPQYTENEMSMTDDMEAYLKHFGVKGMKWGVRKEREVVLEKTCKNGTTLTVTKDPDLAHLKLIGKAFPKFQEHLDKNPMFTFRNGDGKKVGDAYFTQDSPDSLNLMWIGINPKHRGNGYAGAAMEGVVNYARDRNLKRLTLEVPGNAPDARHIYEKLGFRDTGKIVSVDDPMWGGLTEMAYDISPASVKHSAVVEDDLFEYIFRAIDSKSQNELEREDAMGQTDDMEEFLAHYGVKGMRWGHSKGGSASASLSRPSVDRRQVDTLLKKPTASLTNKQLKNVNNRLQLERSYSDLTKKPSALDKIKKGNGAAQTILATAGVGIAAYNIAKSPAGQSAIAVGKRIAKPAAIAIRAKRAFG